MTYTRRRPSQLGWIAAIPVAIESFKAIESTLFSGGATRDAQRQARCDWFTQAALAGSVTAGRILLAGVTKTASNESPMYTKAIALVSSQAPDILQEAKNAGPFWIDGDDATSSQMRAAVTRELNSLGALAPPTPSRQTAASPAGYTFPKAQMLPAVNTTAGYNWTPIILGAGALGLLLVSGVLTPSRRKR